MNSNVNEILIPCNFFPWGENKLEVIWNLITLTVKIFLKPQIPTDSKNYADFLKRTQGKRQPQNPVKETCFQLNSKIHVLRNGVFGEQFI